MQITFYFRILAICSYFLYRIFKPQKNIQSKSNVQKNNANSKIGRA